MLEYASGSVGVWAAFVGVTVFGQPGYILGCLLYSADTDEGLRQDRGMRDHSLSDAGAESLPAGGWCVIS